MAEDKFSNTIDSPIAPSDACFAIAPSDTGDLLYMTKALYIGEDGDVMLVPARLGAPVLDVRARAVRLTVATATSLVGLA